MIILILPSGEADAEQLIRDGKAKRVDRAGDIALEDKQLLRLPVNHRSD